jgi:serine/threonine protein kinase
MSNVFVDYSEYGGSGGSDIRYDIVKVGGFGTTCHTTSIEATQGRRVGLSLWNSPEMLLEEPYTTATDIWSFGVTVRR